MSNDRDWTDFNRRDPGITILEALAYSLIAVAGATALARWRTRRNAHRIDSKG